MVTAMVSRSVRSASMQEEEDNKSEEGEERKRKRSRARLKPTLRRKSRVEEGEEEGDITKGFLILKKFHLKIKNPLSLSIKTRGGSANNLSSATTFVVAGAF